MSLSKRYKRQSLHFEVIPIIDVMFTLLIFFVIYSSVLSGFSNHGIKLKLPAAASAAKEMPGLVINIDSQLQVFLNGELTPPDVVRYRVADRVKVDPSVPVTLSADRQTPYDMVVRVLDDIRLGGASNVVLEAQKKHDPDVQP